MSYAALIKARDSELNIVEVDDKSIYSDLSRIIGAPLVEIVKTQRLKELTEDPETGMFMCMVIDDNGFNAENVVRNDLGSYLYDGDIVGDIVLCKFKPEPLEHVVKGFDSKEEALAWIERIPFN